MVRQLTMVLAGCVLLTAVAVAYVFDAGRSEALLQRSGAQLASPARELGDRLAQILADTDRDLRFLSATPALQAVALGSTGAPGVPGPQAAREHRSRLFAAFLASHPEYRRAQFNALGDGAPADLPRPGDQVLMQRALAVPAVSTAIWNSDLSAVAQAPQLAVLSAMAVRDPAGRPLGVLLLERGAWADVTAALRRLP